MQLFFRGACSSHHMGSVSGVRRLNREGIHNRVCTTHFVLCWYANLTLQLALQL